MKTSLTTFLEDTNKHLKDAQKVINKFKKEHAASFRSKEFEISAEAAGPNDVKISIKINRFLDGSEGSEREFDMLTKELAYCAVHYSDALSVKKKVTLVVH